MRYFIFAETCIAIRTDCIKWALFLPGLDTMYRQQLSLFLSTVPSQHHANTQYLEIYMACVYTLW